MQMDLIIESFLRLRRVCHGGLDVHSNLFVERYIRNKTRGPIVAKPQPPSTLERDTLDEPLNMSSRDSGGSYSQ